MYYPKPFTEPIPDYESPSPWPMAIAWVVGAAGTLLAPTDNPLIFLLYIPYAILFPRFISLTIIRRRRYRRALAAWNERMYAHHRAERENINRYYGIGNAD